MILKVTKNGCDKLQPIDHYLGDKAFSNCSFCFCSKSISFSSDLSRKKTQTNRETARLDDSRACLPEKKNV